MNLLSSIIKKNLIYFNQRSYVTSLSNQIPTKVFSYTSIPSNEKRRLVPEPRDGIATPKDFLSRIGRGCDSVADKFQDWNQLFTTTSEELEAKGIKPGMRKYILSWREWYRRGKDLNNVPIAERQRKHLKRKEQNKKDQLKRIGLA